MTRKWIAIVLMAALMLAPMAAQAEYVKTANAGGTLNLREGPGKEYGVGGYVQDGDEIGLTGYSDVDGEGYTWVEIDVYRTGKTGYIKDIYVSSTPSTAKVANKSIHIPNGTTIIVRGGPGTNYAILDYVHENDKVTVLSGGAVWARVKLDKNGTVGYIKHKYIYGYSGGYSGGGSSYSAPVTSGYYGTATVATKYASSTVNLRTGPGTGYPVVASLGRGTQVTVNSASGNWYNVTTSYGYNGYIYKTYLSFASSYSASGAHVTAGVNLRTGPGTGYYALMVVPKGAAVTVVGASGNWTKVSYGGYTGYVYSAYVAK